MADSDKLNIDNIISRLLEGERRPRFFFGFALNPPRFWNASSTCRFYRFENVENEEYSLIFNFVFYWQCAVPDPARMCSSPRAKSGDCVSSPGRSSCRNPFCWSSRRHWRYAVSIRLLLDTYGVVCPYLVCWQFLESADWSRHVGKLYEHNTISVWLCVLSFFISIFNSLYRSVWNLVRSREYFFLFNVV